MNHVNRKGHGGYERRDISVAGIVYFLVALAALCLFTALVVNGIYHYLDKRTEAQQAPVSPLVTNAPKDTRKLPADYKTDSESTDYEKYLQKNFAAPQLETNERTELNKIRTHEDETLATYGWVDENAGTVHIPIERAMDLLVQRGLPVREPAGAGQAEGGKNKGTK